MIRVWRELFGIYPPVDETIEEDPNDLSVEEFTQRKLDTSIGYSIGIDGRSALQSYREMYIGTTHEDLRVNYAWFFNRLQYLKCLRFIPTNEELESLNVSS